MRDSRNDFDKDFLQIDIILQYIEFGDLLFYDPLSVWIDFVIFDWLH